MELKTLRYFSVLAEEMHFGRAASRLHISQPPLSLQIMKLERELGFPLFDRSKRSVELTPAGAAFLGEVRKILDSVQYSINVGRQTARGEIGRLAIAFFLGATYTLLPRVLRLFRASHPGVELSLHDMELSKVADAVANGDVDVGFLRLPVNENVLDTQIVQREPLVAAIPEAHRLARVRRLRLRDLAQEPLVMASPSQSALYSRIIQACHDVGFHPNVVQEARRPETLVGLVGAGVGIALVPASVRMRGGTGVTFKKIEGRLPVSEIAIAWRSRSASPLVDAFVSTSRTAARSI